MRRIRLTAATVAGMIALGGTIAGASGDDTADQTVTITVVETEALELTIAPGSSESVDETLDVTVSSEACPNPACALISANNGATLTAKNPTGSSVDFAEVTVTRTSTTADLVDGDRDLSLTLVPGAGTGMITTQNSGCGSVLSQPRFGQQIGSASADERIGVSIQVGANVAEGTDDATFRVGWSLRGTPGLTPVAIASDFTYTIAEQTGGALSC